jgi:hypothetical protein
MVMMIAGALAFCAPVWSDVRIFSGGSNAERMCYCDCDAKPGSKMCAHMCELPKYESRAWATSCHRPAESESAEPSSAPGARSSKDNSVQQAHR